MQHLRNIIFLLAISSFTTTYGQKKEIQWNASLLRNDHKIIPFTIRSHSYDLKYAYIQNGSEKLSLKNYKQANDSIYYDMPVFESSFALHQNADHSWNGFWIRNGVNSVQRLPIIIQPNKPRFATEKTKINITGKYALAFGTSENPEDSAIGNFQQKDNKITGSILTPTGDYRFMEGVARQDSFFISTFDGVHSIVFQGKKLGNNVTGEIFGGANYLQAFTGKKELDPQLPETAKMYLKDSLDKKLNFAFRDLDSNLVSINDPRFKNKVVIIDLMGSWCPNCMDETKFLSDFYNKNKNRGVEVISLAYEYTADWNRSKKSLEKFVKQFDIQYPVLLTGVPVGDPERTEKTLPQLTKIKMFPSTIILNKKGEVADIDTGFEGPGTGEYYTEFVQKFNKIIDHLLAE